MISCLLLAATILGQVADTPTLQATEKQYEEQIRKQPSAELWQRLGLARHLQNRYSAAIPAFQEAIRLDPKLWTAHLFLGIDLYRTNQFAAAITALESANKLAPREHPGRDDLDYWLGATRIALKQPLRGLQSLEHLLARNPKHVEALDLATQTYAGLGSTLWNQVAERHFETAAGYQIHGHALEDEGNRPAAMTAYRQSKSLNERRPGSRLDLARLLLQEGNAAEALALLREELTLSHSPESFLYAGLAAAQLGNFKEAAPWLTEASQWSATKTEAQVALAQLP